MEVLSFQPVSCWFRGFKDFPLAITLSFLMKPHVNKEADSTGEEGASTFLHLKKTNQQQHHLIAGEGYNLGQVFDEMAL